MPVTHVTGIVCGNGYASGGKYQGIAPESHIIAVKILDRYGQGNSAQAISGLRWIMDNATKYNIKVVNLSIGTNDRKINVPLMEAVNRLWSKGITVVAAAGNPDLPVCADRNAALSGFPSLRPGGAALFYRPPGAS